MWTFQVAETDGTPICDLFDARSRKVIIPLAGAPTMSWETDGNAYSAFKAEELTTDILGWRDGQLMFRGRVGSTQDTISATGHTVAWNAVGYQGAFARRLVLPTFTRSWVSVDQALIVKSFITQTQAQADGALGIDTTHLAATGTIRDYSADIGKPVEDAITDLSQMINGFDWSVEPDLTARIWAPERGGPVAWAAVSGVTVTDVTVTTDTTTFASDVLGVGGEGTTPVVSSRTPRTRGRWESSVSWSDVTVQGTLAAHTQGQLAADDWVPGITMNVTPGRWTPTDAWLGDTVGVYVNSGRLSIADQARIMQFDFTIDDTDLESVAVTVDRVAPNLKTQLGRIVGRVGNLERR